MAFDPTDLDSASAQAQLLYIAYFGRAGEQEGIEFWSNFLQNEDNGADLQERLTNAADRFADSTEAEGRFPFLTETDPSQSDIESFVDSVFQELFGRSTTDQDNVSLFVERTEEELAKDVPKLGNVILDIANGAQNEDETAIENKIAASDSYTQTLIDQGLSYDEQEARDLVDGVDDETSDPAQDGTDAASDNDPVDDGEPGDQPADITLTVDADQITGTSGDDLIRGPLAQTGGEQINTFNSSDVIDGGKGTDTLDAVFPGQGSGFGEAFIRSDVDNVENFELRDNTGITFDWGLADDSLGGEHVLRNSNAQPTFLNVPAAPDSITLDNLIDGPVNAAGNLVPEGLIERFETGVLSENGDTAIDLTFTDVDPDDNSGNMQLKLRAEDDSDVRFTTANVTSSGADNNFDSFQVLSDDESDDDTDETLNIEGSGDFTLNGGATTNADVVAGSGATGDLTLTMAEQDTKVTTGEGDDTLTFNANNDHTVETGAGDDTVTSTKAGSDDDISLGAGDDTVLFETAFTADDTVDGGDGTDTLGVTEGFTEARPDVTNVEVLQLSSGYAGDTYEVDELTGTTIERVQIIDGFGNPDSAPAGVANATVSDVAAGTVIDLEGNIVDADGDGEPDGSQNEDGNANNIADGAGNIGNVTVSLEDDDGGNDALDFEIGRPEGQPDDGQLDELRVGTVQANNIEIVNFDSIGASVDDDGGTSANDILQGKFDSITELNVTGSTNLDLGTANGAIDTAGTIEDVNAEDFTGDLKLTVDGDTDGAQGGKDTTGVDINAGSGDDTLTGGTEGDDIDGGDGDDTIDGGDGADDLVGGAGDDTFLYDNAADAEPNESIDGEGGNDTVKVDNAATNAALTVDFQSVQIANVETFEIGDSDASANNHTVIFEDSQLNGTSTTFEINDTATANGAQEIIQVEANENTTDLRDLDIDDDFDAKDGDRVQINGDSDSTTIFGTDEVDVIDSGADGGTSDEVTGGEGDDIFLFTEFDNSDVIQDFSVGDERLVIDNDAGMNSLGADGTLNVVDTGGSAATFGGLTAGNPTDPGQTMTIGTLSATNLHGSAGQALNNAFRGSILADFSAAVTGFTAGTGTIGTSGSTALTFVGGGAATTITVNPFNFLAFGETSNGNLLAFTAKNTTTQMATSGQMITVALNTITIAEVGQDFSEADIFLT
jgi:uncharacterized spore protein YtfJ